MPSDSRKKKSKSTKAIISDADTSESGERTRGQGEKQANTSRSTSPEVEAKVELPSRAGREDGVELDHDHDSRESSEDRIGKTQRVRKLVGKKRGPSRLLEADLSEKVKDYLDNHRDLSVKPPRRHPDMKIYPEEEVFVLQYHKSLLDPEEFLGKKIYMSGKTKMKEEGLELCIENFPDSLSKTITLVSCPDKKLQAETFPLAGRISLTRTIEKQEISYDDVYQDNDHEEFPKDLKVRHPLLGFNFEEKLAEIESVVIKTESPEPEPHQPKAKRKRDRESTSPRKPAKKTKRDDAISEDLKWIQNV